MNLPNYSILMSVYHKENPLFLRQAMNSMWYQTVASNDFVLVCDGPLTPELDKVIEDMAELHPGKLNVVRLEKNSGLGNALQIGVQKCKNDLIARMDSDDISFSYRCEKELEVFAKHPELSIVGGLVSEFLDHATVIPTSFKAIRLVPENNDEIVKFARKRNPFNHPSVMFRKKDVLAAGNYTNVRYMQDYYLWAHMLIQGFKGYNIQETLVLMRTNKDFFKRRSGKQYRIIQTNLFRYMRDQHFISNYQYMTSCILRNASGIAPNWLRQILFRMILRKQ